MYYVILYITGDEITLMRGISCYMGAVWVVVGGVSCYRGAVWVVVGGIDCRYGYSPY